MLAQLKLKEKLTKNRFFDFYFFIQDFSLNIALILLRFYTHVHNIHMEGTVSQIFDMGPSFISMTKNGKIFIIFS